MVLILLFSRMLAFSFCGFQSKHFGLLEDGFHLFDIRAPLTSSSDEVLQIRRVREARRYEIENQTDETYRRCLAESLGKATMELGRNI